MLTTLPPLFCESICFTANCVAWIKPSKLVDDSARKSSGVYSVNGFTKKIPALFTRASTEPNRCTAVPTIISAVEARPMSPSTRASLSELCSSFF